MNVTKGDPSPEELAALVVGPVIALRPIRAEPPPRPARARRALRRPLVRGSRGWWEPRRNLGGQL
ncbi:acyl-CoA carboxylase subunit epsilon [Nonomuraea terrae]|uniref:Acyl-CoA carboxylase subunit epsilon n=1 Tax=Nonomuraea terrae TaxID=2530383 RepID=A0A4R4YL05_9ACTN|nr:acyl-CoA carboxylase epsilon subunit [Nonomuraea terrae]TDD45090.1 acyl-CoA carboxylase subunit epsilon [Nonomuraea terrae]